MSKRDCHGNYMLEACKGHYDCPAHDCYGDTMEKHSECDCEYKRSCHLGRQHIQVWSRDELKVYSDVKDCAFYKAIKRNRENISRRKEKAYE